MQDHWPAWKKDQLIKNSASLTINLKVAYNPHFSFFHMLLKFSKKNKYLLWRKFNIICPPSIFLTMQYKPYIVENNPQSNYLMFQRGEGEGGGVIWKLTWLTLDHRAQWLPCCESEPYFHTLSNENYLFTRSLIIIKN